MQTEQKLLPIVCRNKLFTAYYTYYGTPLIKTQDKYKLAKSEGSLKNLNKIKAYKITIQAKVRK